MGGVRGLEEVLVKGGGKSWPQIVGWGFSGAALEAG